MKKKKVTSVNVRSFNPTANLTFNIVIAIFTISCVVPFFFVIIILLTSEGSLAANGYRFRPKEFSLETYRYIFRGTMNQHIIHALGVTVFITVTGTIVNAAVASLYACVISYSSFPFRKFFTLFALVTMLFSPGMATSYLVMTNSLQLKDTIWALTLSLTLEPFNILVMQMLFKRTMPDSIIESAHTDGASEMHTFVSIVLPLAVPGIATISLFAALGYWSDWFSALLYIQEDTLVPLQYLLMKIQNSLEFLSRNTDVSAAAQEGLGVLPSESARVVIVILSTLPVASTHPFFQKYFVGGLTVGDVKK